MCLTLSKSEGVPKDILNHRHPKTYYWTLHYPSERRDPAPTIRTQAHAPPTRKTSQDTNPTPCMGTDSTTKNKYDLENFFFLINHCLFPLHISAFTLTFAVLWSFLLCFFCLEKEIHFKIFFLFLFHPLFLVIFLILFLFSHMSIYLCFSIVSFLSFF